MRAITIQQAKSARLAVLGRVSEQHQILSQYPHGFDGAYAHGRVKGRVKFIQQGNGLPILAHQLAARCAGANLGDEFVEVVSHGPILR